jgi:hypothetical protein
MLLEYQPLRLGKIFGVYEASAILSSVRRCRAVVLLESHPLIPSVDLVNLGSGEGYFKWVDDVPKVTGVRKELTGFDLPVLRARATECSALPVLRQR